MKNVIHTAEAPQPIGPYSQAIQKGHLIYTAGQLGIDPQTGQLVGPDAAAQTRQAMVNLQAVLKAAGADFSHIIKTTIFVVDLAEFKTINAVYGEFFTGEFPARSTVQVAALPLGGRVEIEAMAIRD
jgi:2-iminobutanoate/2-iminopropanoate deaminase